MNQTKIRKSSSMLNTYMAYTYMHMSVIYIYIYIYWEREREDRPLRRGRSFIFWSTTVADERKWDWQFLFIFASNLFWTHFKPGHPQWAPKIFYSWGFKYLANDLLNCGLEWLPSTNSQVHGSYHLTYHAFKWQYTYYATRWQKCDQMITFFYFSSILYSHSSHNLQHT